MTVEMVGANAFKPVTLKVTISNLDELHAMHDFFGNITEDQIQSIIEHDHTAQFVTPAQSARLAYDMACNISEVLGTQLRSL